MLKQLIIGLFVAGVALAQTAKFPTSVAGNGQLMVAGNNVASTLGASAGAADTSLTVTSTTGFVANMLLTFSDSNEIAVICSVSAPNQLFLGYGGTCPSISGRGFDGTTATTHASGAAIADWYTAWHHNALRVEIEAIETTLGANLANVLTGVTFPLVTAASIISCPTCVRAPSALTNNAVVIGSGSQDERVIAASTNPLFALFATAGAPAFRAVANADLPGGGSMTINGTTCTLNGSCNVNTGFTCSVSSPSTVCTHNLNTSYPSVACFDGGGNMVAAQGASTGVNTFLVTSDAALNCRFR